MNFLIAVKIFADLCLYFGLVGGAFPWFGDTEMFLLWPPLLCAAGVWLGAMGETRPILRFAGLLPPLVSLLLAGRLSDFILLAPALIYTAIILLLSRFELNREEYQTYFTHSFCIAGIVGVYILICATSTWRYVVYALALYLLLGIFLLLQLRLTQDGWHSRGLNMLSLVVVITLGGVLCLLAWLVLQLSGPVWTVISNILVYILSGIVYAGVFLSKLLASLGVRGPEEIEWPDWDSGKDPLAEQLEDPINPVTDQVLNIIGIVLAVLIAILVIWRMLKTTKKRKAVAQRMSSTERIDVPRETLPNLFSSNRDKVRRSYRKFMQLLLDRGVKLKESDTTAEIQSSADFLQDPAPASQLRQLYLTARYDEEAEVTSQQAKEAKDLLKTIRKDPELFQ